MINAASLELLEFPRLLNYIAQYAHSDATVAAVNAIRPLSSAAGIQERVAYIEDIRRLTSQAITLEISSFQDIRPLLHKTRPDGAVLDASELAQFIPVFSMLDALSGQLKGREDISALRTLTDQITGFPSLLKMLRRSVDAEGNILDSASSQLAQIRREVKALERRIRKRLEDIVHDDRVAVFLQDDFITQRSGRWVIPVRMDSKGQVAGVVHDVSRSGDTAFVEPLSIIHYSNELENLIADQKTEEIRILRTLSAQIREEAVRIEHEFHILVQCDMLHSVAEFADSLHAQVPQINDDGIISLLHARHPLLHLSLQRSGRGDVVPLSVELGGTNSVMVITGSNAGGKTIAIKTIGLLLAMALAGMPVPASSGSNFPLVDDLLIDMGDEQSIETNLSTFSAHISNISKILQVAGTRTMVLLDELGTGTDPDEGAALACAILQQLQKKGSLVFATTHLADIKGFVHRTAGMLNASMEFDRKTLQPLYRLRLGEPGQSYAMETAVRYGLPQEIVHAARAMLGTMKVEFDQLIAELNDKRTSYESLLHELEQQRIAFNAQQQELQQKMQQIHNIQRETLARAYQEAVDVVRVAKREAEQLLLEARRDEKKRREIVRQLGLSQKHFTEKQSAFLPQPELLPFNTLQEGDIVFVRSLGYDAKIVNINYKHERVRVQAGTVEIEVAASDLEKKKGRQANSSRPSGYIRAAVNDQVPLQLNIIGKRSDDALQELEPFLNRAALQDVSSVTIIHGIGTGALAKAIHEYLTCHPLVKHFRRGEPQEGGAGVTVVTLM